MNDKTNIANQLINAGTELDNMKNATAEDAFDKINIIVNSTDLFNEHEITHCPYCGCRFRNPRQN